MGAFFYWLQCNAVNAFNLESQQNFQPTKKYFWKIENAEYIFAAVLLSDAYQERQRVMAQ